MTITDIELGGWYKINSGYFMPLNVVLSANKPIRIVGTRIKCVFNEHKMRIVLSEDAELTSLEELTKPCEKPIDYLETILNLFRIKNKLRS